MMRKLLLAVTALMLAGPALAAPVPVPDVIENAVEGAIKPGFAALAAAAEGMEAKVAALCAAPDQARLDAVRAGFGDLVLAFSRVEFVRFGPLSADNRFEKLLFWPDRKGIALKQIQSLLATPPEANFDIAGKSVALQGLTALEFVLFGTGSDALAAGAADRCTYADAIARGIVTTTAAINADWQAPDGIAHHLIQPEAGNSDFRTGTEGLEALLGAMAHGVEAIRDTRLLPFIGKDGADPKPKSALFWRSGLTGPALRENFSGIAALYETSRIGQAVGEADQWIDNGVRFEFSNAARAGKVTTSPVETGLGDAHELQGYKYMLIVTRSLQTLLGENLSAALGLSVGFSSLDGD